MIERSEGTDGSLMGSPNYRALSGEVIPVIERSEGTDGSLMGSPNYPAVSGEVIP
ncbi:hypothetical protein [Aeromicrobium sp. Sec7.5]|uniref:hypothetical protein n=1 Tax=Aeromicrobium sp. Sec7.5 TaxID=3121276 RepID=UPI002FE4A922